MMDELFCQLLHGRWARVISYSRQGAWQCVKRGCRAQARRDAARGVLPPPGVPPRTDEQDPAA
jgi:hypothetical protein